MFAYFGVRGTLLYQCKNIILEMPNVYEKRETINLSHTSPDDEWENTALGSKAFSVTQARVSCDCGVTVLFRSCLTVIWRWTV